MVNVNDIKNGMTIVYEGAIYTILEFQHVKPGKGAAFVKTKLKNIRTGSTVEKTFNSSIKLEKAMIEKKPMQFLYATGEDYNFMDMNSYEQIELNKDQIGEFVSYLKENLEVNISFYQGELLGLVLPDKIEVEVTSTEPAVKGNTTNNTTKDCIVETGLLVKVPLFIEQGEIIVVSTSDGKYVSRA
ncbi:MAG: elongation factor P [Mycoplasmatota bacterium]